TPQYSMSASGQATCYGGGEKFCGLFGWGGSIYKDTVQVGTISSLSTSLVGISNQKGGFFNDNDCKKGHTGLNSNEGIMGLAGSDLAIPATAGYMDVLNSKQSFPNIYAMQYCMVGGNIWFGNFDSTYTDGTPPVYTPIIQAHSFYYINLEDM